VIQALCGSPGFDVMVNTNSTDADVNIAYLEWDAASPNFSPS
jgi:hypothetical protein